MTAERPDSTLSRVTSTISNHVDNVVKPDYSKPPIWLKFRSNTIYIITTIGIGIFTDLFLYGLIVPVVPFMLEDRIGIPRSEVQKNVSMLLAVYASASVVLSPLCGVLADKMSTRQLPFLLGLIALLLSTLLFAAGRSIPVLVIARVLQGLSGAVVWTIGLAMCLETVGPKRLGTAIGTVCVLVLHRFDKTLITRIDLQRYCSGYSVGPNHRWCPLQEEWCERSLWARRRSACY